MLTANFTINTSAGDVYGTEFFLSDISSGNSVYQRSWDFGDGNLVYNTESPSHIYKFPGTYNISLSVSDFDGNNSYISKQVIVDFAFRDYLKFTQIPENYPEAGNKTNIPFKFEVLATDLNSPLLVDLFCANSDSAPYEYVKPKWRFLNPTWRFLDKNLNTVTTLSVEPVKVYKNNKVVAISGESEFYFIDSMGKGNPVEKCPLLITATLQTSGFSNYLDSPIYSYPSYANNDSVRSALIWQVNDLYPTRLKVTGNYLDRINPLQWQDVKIPIMVTCHSNRNDLIPGSKNELSEVLFSYPGSNDLGNLNNVFIYLSATPIILVDKLLKEDSFFLLQEKGHPINIENNFADAVTIIDTLPLSTYNIDPNPLNFQAFDSEGYRVGGYLFSTATVFIPILDTVAIAKTRLPFLSGDTSKKFIYPGKFAPNTSVWVSNPNRNTLNKIILVPYNNSCTTIEYFKNKNNLVDGSIKKINVPSLSTVSTNNYMLSGFSGIYSMSIDPRQYDVIAADVELDCIYKFSNEGEILKTFCLSSLNDFDSRKKMLDFWSWATPSPSISSTNFSFYSPAFRSNNAANYIVTIGGLIQPSVNLELSDFNTLRVKPRPYKFNSMGTPVTAFDESGYPQENLELNVIQIFNPLLPKKYIDSLNFWCFNTRIENLTQAPTTSFPLTGSSGHLLYAPIKANAQYEESALSNNPLKYFVSVEGIYQKPNSYTIDTINKKIIFSEPINPDFSVNVVYIKESLTPAYWEFNFETATSSISLKNNPNYIQDEKSGFLITIGGVLQKPTDYYFDVHNDQIIFNTEIPSLVDITVLQITVEENFDVPAAYTPSSVSIDKNYNVWVTLFNSVSVLKFDPDLNLLFSTVPKNIHWEKINWTNTPKEIDYQSSLFEIRSRYDFPDFIVDDYHNEFFLKPGVAETDRLNNCWVTYTHPLCSFIAKYSETGIPLAEISTGIYSIPLGLAINSDNNVWVANSHNSSYFSTPLSGSLQLYDSLTFELLSSVKGFSRPQYLTIDRDDNLWFSHGKRRIGYLDTTNGMFSSWTLDPQVGFTLFDFPSAGLHNFDETDLEEDEEIGGLAVDVYNRVWILDSKENQVWVISATPFFAELESRFFKINPDNVVGYYPDINNTSVYEEVKEGFKHFSLQASGDWTGNRWYQKYITNAILSAVDLYGISEPFSVYPFKNIHQIKRINESFNTSEYYKKLALPENLKNNSIFFDNFINAALGDGKIKNNQDIGQTVYERIANFVSNHADIDTCNVKQLLSFAEQVAQPALDFGGDYPSEIVNFLDIASIPRSKLWGTEEKIPQFPQSIGNYLDTTTTILTAGTKIIAKNKFNNRVEIVSIPRQDTMDTFPLSSFYGYGLNQPIFSNYLFYDFNPQFSQKYIENIIDWNSEETILSRSLSSNDNWLGDNGVVETSFRYLLTKNIFVK